MPPRVSFIGWHNSGKTTVASRVVAQLKARGYLVAVVKSTKEAGIISDQPGTDTACYQRAGADGLALSAPDQLLVRSEILPLDLGTLAAIFFPNVDLVIGEGFKYEENLAKIEVVAPGKPRLATMVPGVIALVTESELNGPPSFRPEESEALADFLEDHFLRPGEEVRLEIRLNGAEVVVSAGQQLAVRAALAALAPAFPLEKKGGKLEIILQFPPDSVR